MALAMCARALALLVLVAGTHSLTLDEEATNNLISAAGTVPEGGAIAILIRGPHGKSARREELFHAKGTDDASFSLFYNRKSNKVTLESLHGGHLKSVSWSLSTHSHATLLLIVASTRVQLFIGCRALHWHAMPSTHNLLTLLASQKLQLYHEESAPVEIYGNQKAALNYLRCNTEDSLRPPTLVSVDDDVVEVKDFMAKEGRRKREEQMQGDDYRTNYIDENVVGIDQSTQRGDIPATGIEMCDDGVVRELQLLRQTIELLRREIGDQKGTIDNLRAQLRQCCYKPITPAPPPKERCTSSSCYPGVECHETTSGIQCGACPRGMEGDGRRCEPITCDRRPCSGVEQCIDTDRGYRCERCPGRQTSDGQTCYSACRSNPCFGGRVQCEDLPDGSYRCGPCPSGYQGNGEQCYRVSLCRPDSCFPGVECHETESGPRCGRCPSGYYGNGQECVHICDNQKPCGSRPCRPISSSPFYKCEGCSAGQELRGDRCVSVDQCDLYNPCDELVSCRNVEGGFVCGPCPAGYEGSSGWSGSGNTGQREHCHDVDECARGVQCPRGRSCVNTPGSYNCVPCGSGYYGMNITGGTCLIAEDLVKRCDPSYCARFHAICSYGVKCVCATGWAGNGTVCGQDTDLDGYPDHQLPCNERHCKADNCPDVSNSGQEDADRDGLGDSCDPDADGDGIANNPDNCPLTPNPDQADRDEDRRDNRGDACDNCPYRYNPGQEDTDGDGQGDVCDPDIDDDGIPNEHDNCPSKANRHQEDMDGDYIGDVCDNCPRVRNPSQEDADKDNVGDACDSDVDRDQDGIQDGIDNCPNVANSDQQDVDNDGRGDVCDDDDDGDGIPDEMDNCPIVHNPDQADSNGDGIGDACDNDHDGDTVINELDNCPNNSKIYRTDFREYMTVRLDPEGESQQDPNWEIYNEGAEVRQTLNSDPGLAVGFESFGGVDFEGTLFVDTPIDDDYVGFIFGYQNNKRFYVVMWKKNTQTYWQTTPFRAVAEPGIQLKLVNSKTGPGKILRNALWNTESTQDQVTLLWKDPRNVGWREKTAYRWRLLHRPKIGLIRLKIYEGSRQVADSGNVYDFTLKGGRLGVFCFSQEMIIWSKLEYRCNDKIPTNIVSELLPRDLKKVDVDNGFVFV
ncbi:cartilage oligomeric matrix protein [Hyposmocoma kahamanoa]|uniref:cartilage oligomeric matrix protein n=1 Tax=Hyposmocoma kahamanoa TaxID=1477025 RepID=UPI000E6D9656|nr:cartilage oligomeric matrix protein [Hyposmocoma kahamanoa]